LRLPVCFRRPPLSTYLSTIWGKDDLFNVLWLIWVVSGIWECSVGFLFSLTMSSGMSCFETVIQFWRTVPEQPISELIGNEKNNFRIGYSETVVQIWRTVPEQPFLELFFVDNEFRNGLFWNYSPDSDDSFRTVHFWSHCQWKSNDLRCHHCTTDTLSLLNYCFIVVDDTRRRSKPLLLENIAATIHLHCISRTSFFQCYIALMYRKVKMSLQIR